jgi:serine/threonine-protein kinase HipA
MARRIMREVGAAVARWREAAGALGLSKNSIERMASAFEHEDLRQATS